MARYLIEGVFAEGAQGRLHKAFDTLTGRKCILKTGHTVREEAFLALELNHPYIAKPFDFGMHSELGECAVFPEFSEPTLQRWKPKHDIDLRRAVLQIVEFLAYLHHRGWLYHDFKPEHFLVSDQQVHVLDLGLCRRIQDHDQTFSGTFPFIAPERLAGRRGDPRSDIFALGLMLLSVLLPQERWDYEPSLPVLQELPKRAKKLLPFWRDLISEMTAQEPSQRCESAQEVWKKLLPEKVRKNQLFFPIRGHLTDGSQFIEENRIVAVRSSSLIHSNEVQNQALLSAWKSGLKSVTIDFREKGVEDSLDILHRIFLGQPSKDFFSCVTGLQTMDGSDEIFLLFRGQERLSPQKRALFAYAISALIKSHFRILVITSKSLPDLSEESCKFIELPLLSHDEIQRILISVFPSNRGSESSISKTISKDIFSVPEQILNELRKGLSKRDFLFWPAGAKESFVPGTLARLGQRKLTVLGYLAISRTSMNTDVLSQLIPLPGEACERILLSLQEQGFVQWQGNEFLLAVSEREVLNRLKQEQIVEIADNLWKVNFADKNPQLRFRLALLSKRDRLAASTALRIARTTAAENRRDASYEWYWNAFSCGAALPKSLLFRLTKFCMLRAEISRTRQILKYIRKRFGLSYRLLRKAFDFYSRIDLPKNAEKVAINAMRSATRKNQKFFYDYFSLLRASNLVLNLHLEDGESIVRSVSYDKSCNVIRGLVHHIKGISLFYQGDFRRSLRESKTATKFRHEKRVAAFTNTAITHARLGNLDLAETIFRRVIDYCSARNDFKQLIHAHTNLGMTLRRQGRMAEARTHYFKGLQLSRALKNRTTFTLVFSNIAMTYQLEGRVQKAIRFHIMAAKFSRKFELDIYLATAFTDAGLLYAIEGKFNRAKIFQMRALKLRKRRNLLADVGINHEYLGLVYLLSNRMKSALRWFRTAKAVFLKAGSWSDRFRNEIYLALSNESSSDIETIRSLENQNCRTDTFEYGLLSYLKARTLLKIHDLATNECRTAFHDAERIFRQLSDLFWLGKTLSLKAEYYLETGHYEKSSLSLQSAFNVFSRLGAKNELKEISKRMVTMKSSEELIHRMAEKLPYKILLMIQDVLAERDPDKMIEEILHTTLQFTDMQRAVLILDEDPPRIFKSASIEEAAVQEIREISHSAMNSAIEKRKSFVCLDVTTDKALRNRPSIVGNRILSVLCFPLKAEDQLIGVLYLDSREGVETISQSETSLLEIFASIISVVLLNLLALEQSIKENKQLRSSIASAQQFPEIFGNSDEIRGVRDKIYRLLNHELPVLITGETGTGKELVARVLHSWSKRKESPFVAINCSAISKSLLENELFGHEKGSFTGAHQMKLGLFEEAGAGTVFLDEIGDMALSMQSKLLRVLQEGEFRRVGGNKVLHTSARIVLATNKNLLTQVRKGRFREDLYYRICGVQIELPSLRNRSQDIPLLARQFLKEALAGSSQRIHGFTPQARELILNYSWPGNVRQLKNEIERIAALTEKDWIGAEDFSPEIQENLTNHKILSEKGTGTLKEIEKKIIEKRLDAHKWNIVHTARSLGLTRHGLYSKMKIFGISKKKSGRTKGPARSDHLSSSQRKKRA